MKSREYSELICRRFCKFYAPGKEAIQCGGYSFLRNNLSPGELRYLYGSLGPETDRPELPRTGSDDHIVEKLICRKCDFLIDGCDFMDDRSGPPCGGYILVKLLL